MSYLISIAYLTALTGFVIFGLHRLVLLVRFAWHKRHRRPLARVSFENGVPKVCVQCPLYNEPLVVEDLLESVTAIRWPRERLEIQILDDSTDETSAIIAAWLDRHPQVAGHCRHVRREDRRGYKAGALAVGIARSDAEFFAVLDADFRPQPDFLEHMMPLFAAPEVAAVQARWEFTNRSCSLLTRIQGVFLDAHFLVEQNARHAAGLFFNFNGTAGIWRRAAIDHAGGWHADTVTEDLDLCYRAQMRGWRMVYDVDYAVPSELPESIAAFKSQQRRWTKGGIQVFRKHAGAVLRAPLPLRVKIEAMFHLGVGFIHVFLVLFALSVVPALVVAGAVPTGPLAVLHPLLLIAGTGATVGLYLASQYLRDRNFLQALLVMLAAPALMAFGLAMCVTCFFALLEGLFADGGEFVRTPKGGSRVRAHSALRGSIARAGLSLVTALELTLGIVLAAAAVHFFGETDAGWVTFNLALQSAGFAALGLSSLYDFGWRAFVGGFTSLRSSA
ncbi:MAG: glycosyltransferase [Opitutaceae bacterium]|nr:glycosyltransferase [Opitutaceae bacterium]